MKNLINKFKVKIVHDTSPSRIDMWNRSLKITNAVLILICVFSFGAKLYFSDRVATAGADLSEVEKKLGLLRKENESLQREYLTVTSMQALNERSVEYGYTSLSMEFFSAEELALR